MKIGGKPENGNFIVNCEHLLSPEILCPPRQAKIFQMRFCHTTFNSDSSAPMREKYIANECEKSQFEY